MSATVGIAGAGTFGPMLKEFYQGPVAEQINNRVWMREYFQKRSKGWSGKQMVIPTHIGRNTGVGFSSEAGAGATGGFLPTAGAQGYVDLRINAHSSYGRFQVSGVAMDTATKSGVGAFAGVMNEEMDRLVRDISNNENSMNIFGGATKGFLNERRALGNNTGGAQVNNGTNTTAANANAVWQYQGDFSYFDGSRTGLAVDPATPGTWVRVELVDMSTYDLIPVTVNATGAAAANANIFVAGFSADQTNPTVTLRVGVNDAGACSFTTANVAGQRAVALRLHDTRAVDNAGADFGQNPVLWDSGPTAALRAIGAQNVVNNQVIGLFENLASQTHFGVARNDTVATGATLDQRLLKSTVITHATVASGDRTDATADLSLERLQYMMDILQQNAGVDANVMVMSALMRHRYTVQLTGTMGTQSNVVVSGDSGKLMDNQQGLAYGGIKFQYDRQFPVATIGLLHTDDWILAELATGQFADEDGNILFRVQNQDAYEGFWKHRYNIACKRPNAQLLLTGITPT